MTITFKSLDSLYKIFTTLKKIPPYKKVVVVFPQRHELFDHPWRWKQLLELIQSYHLNISFLVQSRTHADFFSRLGLTVLYEPPVTVLWWRVNTLRDSITWRNAIGHKKIVSRLIVIAEIAVVLLLGTFFWWVISPTATVTITPNARIRPIVYKYLLESVNSTWSQQYVYTDHMTLKYEKITIPYTTSLSIDVSDITYTSTPALGTVTLYNNLPEPYSLVKWTQLISEVGTILTTQTAVNIPPWSSNEPSSIEVWVESGPISDFGSRQWQDANLSVGTLLLIKNLSESRIMRSLWAEVSWSDLTWWDIEAEWLVTESDIEEVKLKLIETMDRDKKQYLQRVTQDDNDYITVPFDGFISFIPDRFLSDAESWDQLIQVEGVVEWSLTYHRIARKDLTKNISTYLQDRPLPSHRLIDYDEWSLRIYDLLETVTTWDYFVPIKLNTIRGYDFEQDDNALTAEIRDLIVWLSREDAKRVVLSYDEILDATVRMSPRRYDALPDTPDRISFELFINTK